MEEISSKHLPQDRTSWKASLIGCGGLVGAFLAGYLGFAVAIAWYYGLGNELTDTRSGVTVRNAVLLWLAITAIGAIAGSVIGTTLVVVIASLSQLQKSVMPSSRVHDGVKS
jgi:hypothetical protein